MGIHKRNGRWHYRFQHKGRQYAKSTGLAATKQNRTAASRVERALLERLRKAGVQPLLNEEKPFDEAAEEFIRWCETVEYRERPNTSHRIKTSFASLQLYFNECAVSVINAVAIEGYKAWRFEAHGVRPVTVRRDLDALSVFFGRYASKFGWCSSNPVSEVKRPSDADAIRIYVIPEAEEKAYFAKAAEMKLWNIHDLGRLMLNQGCRPEELLALKRDAVDLERGVIAIRGGKSRAARRTLDLTNESREILGRRIAAGESQWVFPSSRKPGHHIVKLNGSHDTVCIEAGVSFVIYDLRHTWATRMAQAGCDIVTLAALLGHSGLRLVARYVHPTAEHKRKAMQRFDGNKAVEMTKGAVA